MVAVPMLAVTQSPRLGNQNLLKIFISFLCLNLRNLSIRTSFCSFDSIVANGDVLPEEVISSPSGGALSEQSLQGEEVPVHALGPGQILPCSLYSNPEDIKGQFHIQNPKKSSVYSVQICPVDTISYCVTGELLLGLKQDAKPVSSIKGSPSPSLTVSVLHCCRIWDQLIAQDAPKGTLLLI